MTTPRMYFYLEAFLTHYPCNLKQHLRLFLIEKKKPTETLNYILLKRSQLHHLSISIGSLVPSVRLKAATVAVSGWNFLK